MTTLILGSRTYAPLYDVDNFLKDVDNSLLYSFGVSDVALRAESMGAKRRPLETTRRTLLELVAEPNARVVLFCCRDSITKNVTAGMAGIQQLLNEKSIPFQVVSSPFPGRICELLTNLRHAVDKAVSASQEQRQIVLGDKALRIALTAIDERNRYEAMMEEGFSFSVGDLGLDDKWIRWCLIYESLCDGIDDAQRVLNVRSVA